jgi:NADPH:quinone reductase-like Zn-dependent oxidoreductase
MASQVRHDQGAVMRVTIGRSSAVRAEGIERRPLPRLRELETRAFAEADAGRLVPHVGSRFPLACAPIEARATSGKVILLPWPA